MDELNYTIDFDEQTGARAYSVIAEGTPHIVGLGLRTLSSAASVSAMLDSAARTGLLGYDDELIFLEKSQQDAIADPDVRAKLVAGVQEEHRLGSYLFEATTTAFDEDLWQKLTLFYPQRSVFRALASEARDKGTLGGVAYPIAPASRFATTLERGTRFGGVEPESLDRFLDLVIVWTTAEIEQNPRKAASPLTTGPSYLFEREVAARVLDPQ